MRKSAVIKPLAAQAELLAKTYFIRFFQSKKALSEKIDQWLKVDFGGEFFFDFILFLGSSGCIKKIPYVYWTLIDQAVGS